MTQRALLYRGRVFDGETLIENGFVSVSKGTVTGVGPASQAPSNHDETPLGSDIIAPGFVDLQVNGGDGLMFNDAPDIETLRRMAKAHRGLGATSILPTLITDTPDTTAAAIAAATEAVAAGVEGIAGLHLEGPHLARSKKGAHDAQLIRPMTDTDLSQLVAAARNLPVLMLTVAPESVTPEQVRVLVDAGALVSLGHTDTDFETANSYIRAGARSVTHLFNAMSQFTSRQPGLVGAALASGDISAGLIADGIHVHPASMAMAWAAKTGPGGIYLVSDAMACAGSDISSFMLNGRLVTRSDAGLRLEDDTLAGADLSLGTAIEILVKRARIPLEQALRAATSRPAALAGLPRGIGRIVPSETRNLIRLAPDFSVRPV